MHKLFSHHNSICNKSLSYLMQLKITLLLVCILLPGCAFLAPFGKEQDNNPLAMVSTNAVQAVVNEDVDTNQYRPLLYIKANLHGPFDKRAYLQALTQGFEKYQFFDAVKVGKPPLRVNVASSDNPENWVELNDRTPVAHIKTIHAPTRFLIAEVALRQHTDSIGLIKPITFSLKFIDPASEKIVFYARTQSRSIRHNMHTAINKVLDVAKSWLIFESQEELFT